MTSILVVAGTTRAKRRSLRIASWVAELGRQVADLDFEPVDLATLGLGLDDEPGLPALGLYEAPTTRAWSARVAASLGVVFVTPQYNWGYPAPLKNAIDHLQQEWRDKPAAIVSYGSRGGGKCAAQLREVFEGLHMRLAPTAPGLLLARTRIEADDGVVEPAEDFAAQADEVRQAMRELAAIVTAPA